MKELYNGVVNPRLVCKRFKDTVFYYASSGKGEPSKVSACMLRYIPSFLTISEFNEEWKLDETSHSFSWENLFFTEKEAKDVANARNNKLKYFRHTPYLTHKLIEEHFEELVTTECLINKLLNSFENYNGIDFCDVHAGGIQVRIHHKKIENYTYGEQKTIEYDFSNIDEIPYMVAREFIETDKPYLISKQLEYIRQGEKYGWD